jgi:hypothetical protein
MIEISLLLNHDMFIKMNWNRICFFANIFIVRDLKFILINTPKFKEIDDNNTEIIENISTIND